MYLCELYSKYNFPSTYSVISKKDVYEFLLNIYNDKSYFLIKETGFKKYFSELYAELLNVDFPEESINWSFQQKLFHFLNNDIEFKLGICYCGKRCKFKSLIEGYHMFCSRDCLNKNTYHKNNVIKTNIMRYGGVAPACSKDVQYKMQNTCFEKLGTYYPGQSYIVKKKANETRIKNCGSLEESYRLAKRKGEETNILKYNVPHYAQTQQFKENYTKYCQEKWNVDNVFQLDWCKEKIMNTSYEKYGVYHYTQSNEYKLKHKETWNNKSDKEISQMVEKCLSTKRKNKTFNTSKIEEQFSDYLTSNNYIFIRQYMSNIYPFPCDFYLPEYDLYVEINGHFSHGHHPYNPNSQDDNNQLKKWISKNTDYYKNAIQVWTQRDPLKRETAKKNKLNYIEIFSNNINEAINKFNEWINK